MLDMGLLLDIVISVGHVQGKAMIVASVIVLV